MFFAAVNLFDNRPRITSARLEYTPLSSPETRVHAAADAQAHFATETRTIFESIDPAVFHTICSLEIADVIREALATIDQGKPDRALKDLRKTAREIRIANAELDHPQVTELLAELNLTIDSLESNGIESIDRKALTATLYSRTHLGKPAAEERDPK